MLRVPWRLAQLDILGQFPFRFTDMRKGQYFARPWVQTMRVEKVRRMVVRGVVLMLLLDASWSCSPPPAIGKGVHVSGCKTFREGADWVSHSPVNGPLPSHPRFLI